jgi:flagellar hook-associated protein 1
VGDNRNALLLGALQTANTLNGGTTTYQGAYSQLVSQIGNKTRELDVTSSAAGRMLSEANLSLQAESGVNLDEEATNLLRYQQAYQAAGKVMQIASQMFDVLLSLGR